MHHFVVSDFFAGAEQLRRAFDDHFRHPHRQVAATHQVWNYWHVPGLYTYLRTRPETVLPAGLVADFVRQLRTWSSERLGLSYATEPTLSVYINGCGQGLHNDSGNGRFGYVYSLTRWERRLFRGGETILFREEPYWGKPRSGRPAAGTNLYELVEPSFNQLLVFDDRLIHGVERLEGTMNPTDGRVVLHGHIRESAPQVTGGLNRADLEPVLADLHDQLGCRFARDETACAGVVSFRLRVAPAGTVDQAVVLTEQLTPGIENGEMPSRASATIIDTVRRLRFPPRAWPSEVILPITVGTNSMNDQTHRSS